MKLLLFDHDSLPKGLYSSLVPDWSVDTSRAWPATHACVRGMSLFSLILIGPWSVPHPGHRPDTCASTDSTHPEPGYSSVSPDWSMDPSEPRPWSVPHSRVTDSRHKPGHSSASPDWSMDPSLAWEPRPWSVHHSGATDSTSQGTLRHHLEIQTECLCATVHVSCAYDDSVDARVKG